MVRLSGSESRVSVLAVSRSQKKRKIVKLLLYGLCEGGLGRPEVDETMTYELNFRISSLPADDPLASTPSRAFSPWATKYKRCFSKSGANVSVSSLPSFFTLA